MRTYFKYILMAICTALLIALAVAVWDFYQTGQPFKGQRLSDLIWHGFYLILVVIMSREVPGYVWSYTVVALFSAWISQPAQRNAISKWMNK